MERESRKRPPEDIAPNCIQGKAPDTFIPKSKVPKIYSTTEEQETDVARLQARLKQISYGKNTTGYDNYIQAVPKHLRQGYTQHPRTPDPTEKQSKRSFDGRIKAWRRMLHTFDPAYLEVGDDLESKFDSTLLVDGSPLKENRIEGKEMGSNFQYDDRGRIEVGLKNIESEHNGWGRSSNDEDDVL